jgi:RNA polymerase sigma-70 factor (ECF subfamily)
VSDDLDREAVRRVRAGDVEAFAGIVERWQGPLVNLAWRFCRDPGQAEEMAQDAFVRAFRALPGWRGEAAFSTWLFSIATNLYRSRVRRTGPTWVGVEEAEAVADPAPAVGSALEREDEAEAVRRAVLGLPARYRDALLLYYFHELDVEAAARTLQLPEGTVKARLSRGRDLLRGKLARHRPLAAALGEV